MEAHWETDGVGRAIGDAGGPSMPRRAISVGASCVTAGAGLGAFVHQDQIGRLGKLGLAQAIGIAVRLDGCWVGVSAGDARMKPANVVVHDVASLLVFPRLREG